MSDMSTPGRSAAHDPSAALLTRTRRKLLLWTALSTMATLVLLGGALYVTAAVSLQNAAEAQLRARVGVMQTFIATVPALPPGGFVPAA
jgi:Tfp pilus assembly protein PilN